MALEVKNPHAVAGDTGVISGLGGSPGGHGNPLQHSCLETPWDRGAWRATVHGITKSRTQLKRLGLHTGVGEVSGAVLKFRVTLPFRTKCLNSCDVSGNALPLSGPHSPQKQTGKNKRSLLSKSRKVGGGGGGAGETRGWLFCKGSNLSAAFLQSSCLLEKAGQPGLGDPDSASPLLPSSDAGHGGLQVMSFPRLLQAPPRLCAHGGPGPQGLERIISENLGDISSNHARKP